MSIQSTYRTLFVQIILALSLIISIYLRTRNLERAGIIAGFTIFYFSSTGYIYRMLPNSTSPATHIIIVILGLFILIALNHHLLWSRYLISLRLVPLTSYLNLVAALTLIYPTYKVGAVLFAAANDANIPWTEIIRQKNPDQTINSEIQPDIYYIILDGYTRQDILLDVFGFDNQEFIDDLRKRNFYVADESRSNYIRTVASLSSSLNMDFINFAEEEAGWRSVNYLPLADLIQHGLVRRLLEDVGYESVPVSTDYAFTNWKDADVYYHPYKTDLTEFERVFLSTTAIGAFYDYELPFTGALRSILPLPSYGTRRERINYSFNQLMEIPQLGRPKFFLVHIVEPHPPFVFNSKGEAVASNRPFAPVDGEGYSGDKTEYRTYFGTNYPLLPDRSYYSPYVNSYAFVEITEKIETTCSE